MITILILVENGQHIIKRTNKSVMGLSEINVIVEKLTIDSNIVDVKILTADDDWTINKAIG